MVKLTDDEIKAVSLDILLEIDRICRENNITYFIAWGTLLGAVRHGGFIPWDDDIDVGMPREDYERFIKVMERETKYSFISAETDPDYYFAFGRVSDKKTVLKLKHMREIHNLGVFVDVFPFDHCPPEAERKEWNDGALALRKKVFLLTPRSAKYCEYSVGTILKIIKKLPARIYYGKTSFYKFRNDWKKLLTKYNDCPADEYICLRTTNIFKSKTLFPCSEILFEGHKLYAPANPEEFLKKKYGDFMQLPPEEKRVSHHHFTAYWKEI